MIDASHICCNLRQSLVPHESSKKECLSLCDRKLYMVYFSQVERKLLRIKAQLDNLA